MTVPRTCKVFRQELWDKIQVTNAAQENESDATHLE